MRCVELCRQNSRDDLVEGVFILYGGMVRTNPSAVPGERDRMLYILKRVDGLLKNAEEVANHMAYQAVAEQAIAERGAATTLH